MCELLFAFGADGRTAIDSRGETAVHRAATSGNPRVCNLLLDEGVSAVAEDVAGNTALYHAARAGCTVTCQLLVAHGAPLSASLRLPKLETEFELYLAAIRDAAWRRRLPTFAAYIATHGVWWK